MVGRRQRRLHEILCIRFMCCGHPIPSIVFRMAIVSAFLTLSDVLCCRFISHTRVNDRMTRTWSPRSSIGCHEVNRQLQWSRLLHLMPDTHPSSHALHVQVQTTDDKHENHFELLLAWNSSSSANEMSRRYTSMHSNSISMLSCVPHWICNWERKTKQNNYNKITDKHEVFGAAVQRTVSKINQRNALKW